jgi:hypothetical protein
MVRYGSYDQKQFANKYTLKQNSNTKTHPEEIDFGMTDLDTKCRVRNCIGGRSP